MSKLLESLAVLCELTGTDWSKPTIRVIEQELSAYPPADALAAIERCGREIRGRVSLADILDRIPSQHPGVEEAWATVSKLIHNEDISIIWTQEMREAYGAVAPLAHDKVAARMAFREKYGHLVSMARAKRQLPTWCVSLGYDRALREECVREATRLNLISQVNTAKLLAHDPPTEEARKLLEAI